MNVRLVGWLAAVAMVSSGCLTGERPAAEALAGSTEEPVSTRSVEVEPGVFVPENRGHLRGTVINDAGFPLADARASLLGTSLFQDSNADGMFLFENLTAGPYELSVQRENYEAIVRDLEVVAANITDVEVVLVPLSSVGGEAREHVHDLWGDRPEVILMDADVDLNAPSSNPASGALHKYPATATYKANTNATNHNDNFRFRIVAAGGGDPPIIFPGTKELRVTFSWTQENIRLPKLGLVILHRNSSGKPTWFPPKASGETWTLGVTPGMPDLGHDLVSDWSFFVYNPNDYRQAPNWSPGLILGPLHVKLVLVKGDLYLEPPHPRFWQGGDVLQIRNVSQPYRANVGDRSEGDGTMVAKPGAVIPPGTGKMRIEFWYYCPDALNNTAADHEWVLTWRTASQPRRTTPLSEYKRSPPVQEGKGFKVYEFDVDPTDVDQFYRSTSRWSWTPSLKGQENSNSMSGHEWEMDRTRGITVAINVWITRDASYGE